MRRDHRYWEIKLKWKLHNWSNRIRHCSDLVFIWNLMMLDIAWLHIYNATLIGVSRNSTFLKNASSVEVLISGIK